VVTTKTGPSSWNRVFGTLERDVAVDGRPDGLGTAEDA